jgi:hypothetical protein
MKNVGPGTYNPEINAVLKVGTSKKMLGRHNNSDRRLE